VYNAIGSIKLPKTIPLIAGILQGDVPEVETGKGVADPTRLVALTMLIGQLTEKILLSLTSSAFPLSVLGRGRGIYIHVLISRIPVRVGGGHCDLIRSSVRNKFQNNMMWQRSTTAAF
jgi:hypothetical protein